MNPQVVEAWRGDGLRLRALRNKPLKVIHATPQASPGRTGGGMAGGGASPPPPSAHQLEPPDEGVLLLVDEPPCDALSPRHDL